eukprot:Skav208485  [mRNA]  locus=scaffold87:56839:58336:- [translate_table: standard]
MAALRAAFLCLLWRLIPEVQPTSAPPTASAEAQKRQVLAEAAEDHRSRKDCLLPPESLRSAVVKIEALYAEAHSASACNIMQLLLVVAVRPRLLLVMKVSMLVLVIMLVLWLWWILILALVFVLVFCFDLLRLPS